MGEYRAGAFRRRRRTLVLQGAAEAGIYPLVIAVWAVVVGAILRSHFSHTLPPLAPILLRDGVVLAATCAAAAPFWLRYLHRRQRELSWLYYWCEVRSRLDEGAQLTTALVIPSGTAPQTPPREVVHGIAQGIARGSDPGSLLHSVGCPADYADLVTEATCEHHLSTLLDHQLEQSQETLERTLRLRLRIAQPVGIVGAGAVVAWVVGRIVRPALMSYVQGLTP
ncbi:MAG: hypothetical protein R6U25_12155 [Alkalispirochaeta sp.]